MKGKLAIIFCFMFMFFSIMLSKKVIDKSRFIEIQDAIKTVLDLPILKNYQPVYSSNTIEKGIIDNIIVYIQVDKYGNVKKAQVLKGKYSFLNEPILIAVKKMKFRPYKENGIAKSVRFLKMFHFPRRNNNSRCIKDEIVFGYLRLPNIIHRVIPKYPKSASKNNIKDVIEIDVTHDIYGRVIETKIIKGKYKVLNDQAIAAIKKWLHEPFTISGNPLKMKYRVIVDFNPKNKYGETKVLYKLEYKESYRSLKHLLDLVKDE